MKSLWLSISMFSVVPVPRAAGLTVDRPTSGRALRWLPLLGFALGAASMLPALAFWRGHHGGIPTLASAVAVFTLAGLTRGLHLDGVADLADGLASRRDSAGALAVMKQSDIGPFGVAALIAVALLQVSALGGLLTLSSRAQGLVSVAVVVASGRLCALGAAGVSTPSARPDGFGALVCGSASVLVLTGMSLLVVAVSAGLGVLAGFGGPGVLALIGAVAVGQLAAYLLRRHAVARLGGITGDVFGALIETGTTASLLTLAAVVAWRGGW